MTQIILPTHDEIRRYARGALREADALDVVPVPLDTITAAIGLAKEDLFDVGLETMPDKMKRLAAKYSGRILGALSKQKTLYVNSAETGPRGRFTQAHELGHESLPWHEGFYFVDNSTTISPDTEIELEMEANSFAADLMFSLDRFGDEADSYAPSLGVPLQLSNKFEVSRHAALRRYAEKSRYPVALITMGRYLNGTNRGFPVYTTQCESSPSFADKYGPIGTLIGRRMTIAEHPSVGTLAEMSHAVHGEPLDVVLDTKRGSITFQGHLFYNKYCRFILLTQPKRLGRKLRVVPTSE